MRLSLCHCLLVFLLPACTRTIPPRPVPPPAFTLAPFTTNAEGWELPAGDRVVAWAPHIPPTAAHFTLNEHTLTRRKDGATAHLNPEGTLDWSFPASGPASGPESRPESGALQAKAMAESPLTGFLYVAMAPNNRAPKGRILEFVPPMRNGITDAHATRFDAGLFLQAGDPKKPQDHAYVMAPAKEAAWLSDIHALAVDASGILWVAGRDETISPPRDALYAIMTEGGWRGRVWRMARAPETASILGMGTQGKHVMLLVQDARGTKRVALQHGDAVLE